MFTPRNAAPRDEAPVEPEQTAEYTSWCQAHEVHALRDTLAVYRRYVVDLAAENERLHAQLADAAVSALRTDGGRGHRTRGDCRR